MVDSGESRFKARSRRNFIKYSGAIGSLGLLAGCGGDSDGGGGGDGSDGGGGDGGDGGRVDETLTIWAAGTEVLGNLQWNPYNSATAGTGAHQAGGNLYDPLVIHAPNTGDLIPTVLADYSADASGGETTIDMEFRDDYYWQNGDPVTAHDYATQIELDMEFTKATSPDARPHVYIEELMQVDDKFARIKLHDNMSERFAVIRALGDQQMLVKRDVGEPRTYGEWVEDLRDASGDEASQVASELSEWRQENPIGNSPWQLTETADNALVFEPFDDHPAAGDINFTQIKFLQTEDGRRAFLDGQVDAINRLMPVPEDLQPEMPESVAKFNDDFDQCIHVAFNGGNTPEYDPITADVNVRRAMAYILDHEVYATNTPVSYEMYDMPNSNIAPGTLGTVDFDIDEFTRYRPDEEKALEHLERAGYSREDGAVVDENGEPAEVTIVTATGISDSFLIHGQTTSSLLEQFGFNTKLKSLDNAGFSERRFAGTYDIIPDLDPFLGPVVDNEPGGWDGWYSDLMHLPETYELPMPIGATGDEVEEYEEFNIVETMSEWQATGDDNVFKKVAWFFNSMAPRITPIVGPDAGRLNTSGVWNADNEKRGITQMRPGIWNSMKHDVEGARIYADE